MPAKRSVPLRDLSPADEVKISGGQRFKSFKRLRLAVWPVSDQLRQMSFRAEGELVHIDLTEPSAELFKKGLADVSEGVGDYDIGPKQGKNRGLLLGELDRASECLWFWPCFGHLGVVK
jgi:hypothetical protein